MEHDQASSTTVTQSGEVIMAKYDNAPGEETMEIEGGQQMEEQVLGYLEVQPSQLQAVQEGGTIYFQSDGIELNEQLILAQSGEDGEIIVVMRTDQEGGGEGGDSLRAMKFGDLAGLAEQMGLAPGTKISLQSQDGKEDGEGITYLTYEAPEGEYEHQIQDEVQSNENIPQNSYLQEDHGEMTEIPVSVSEDGTLTPLRIIEKPSNETNSDGNETLIISVDEKNASENYLHGEMTEIPVSVSEDGTITPLRIVEKSGTENNLEREGEESQCYIAVGVNGEQLNNVEGLSNAALSQVVDGERHVESPIVVHLSSADESRNVAESDSKTTTVEILHDPVSMSHTQLEATSNGESSYQTTIVTADGEHQQVEYRIVQASEVQREQVQSSLSDAECFGQWSAMDSGGQELSNDMIVIENQTDENIRQDEQSSIKVTSQAKDLSNSVEESPVNETLRSIEEFLRTGDENKEGIQVKKLPEVLTSDENTADGKPELMQHEASNSVTMEDQQDSAIPVEISLVNDSQEIEEMEVVGELPQNTTSYVVIDLDNNPQFSDAMGDGIQMESVNFKSVINEHGQSVGILETANGDLEVILDSDSLVPSTNSPFTKSNQNEEISVVSNHSSLQEVLAPEIQKAFQKLLTAPEKKASPEPTSYLSKPKTNTKLQSEGDASKRGDKSPTKAPKERKPTVFNTPPEDLTLKIPTRQYSRTYSKKKSTPPPVASTSKDAPTLEVKGSEFNRNEIILVIEPNEEETREKEKEFDDEKRSNDLELFPKKLEIVCEDLENKEEKAASSVDNSEVETISKLDTPKSSTPEIDISVTTAIMDVDSKEAEFANPSVITSMSLEQPESDSKSSNENLADASPLEEKTSTILPESLETITMVPEKTTVSLENPEKLLETVTTDQEKDLLHDEVAAEKSGVPEESSENPEKLAAVPQELSVVPQEVVDLKEAVETPIENVSVSPEDSLDSQKEIAEPKEDVTISLKDASVHDEGLSLSQDSINPSEVSKSSAVDMEVDQTDDVEMPTDNSVLEVNDVSKTAPELESAEEELSVREPSPVMEKSTEKSPEHSDIVELTNMEPSTLETSKEVTEEQEGWNEKGEESENDRMESEVEKSEIDNDIQDSVLSGGKSISADEENSQFTFESIPDKDIEEITKETIVVDDSNLDSIKMTTKEDEVKERSRRKRKSNLVLENEEAKQPRTGEPRQKVSTSPTVSVIKEKDIKRKLFNESAGKKVGRPKKSSTGGKAYQSQDELFDELLKESLPGAAKKRRDSKDSSRKSKNLNSDVKRRRTVTPRLPNDYGSSDDDIVLSNVNPYSEKKYKSVSQGKRGRGRPRLFKNRGSSDEEEVMMSNLRIYSEVKDQKSSHGDSSKRGRGRPRISKNVSTSSYSRFELTSRISKSEPTKRGRGRQKTGSSYKSRRATKECQIHYCYQQSSSEKAHQIYTCIECHFRTSRMNNIVRHYKDCALDLFPFKSSSMVEKTPTRFKLDGATGSQSLPENRFLNKRLENPKKLSPFKNDSRNIKTSKSKKSDDPNASKDDNSIGTDDAEMSDVLDSEEEDSYDIEMKNTFGFAENDVVWAEWRTQQWPALVRKIYPRQKKVSVLFITIPMSSKGFTMNVKKITNFDDAAKNKDFLEKGYALPKHDQLVKSAQMAEDYLRKKCLGLKMNPIQFFNDPEAAKQMLSELEKSSESQVYDADNSDSHQNDPMTPVTEVNLDRITNPAQEEEDSEINVEIEDKDVAEVDGEKLAKFILDGNADEHLINIFAGIVSSERHRLFNSDSESDRNSVKRASDYKGWIADEGKKVELTQHCMELFKTKIDSNEAYNVVGYAYEVMVPEGILKAISTLHNVSLKEAEEIFARDDVDKTQSIFSSTTILENKDAQGVASVQADVLSETLPPESVVENNSLTTFPSASPPRVTCPEEQTELPT